MPSVVLCSFGTYNLARFRAEYPSLAGGNWEIQHEFADLLSDGVANYSRSYNISSEDVTASADVYKQNDLITFTAAGEYDTPSGPENYTSPQLLGLVRSAAIIAPNIVESVNDYNQTRWCVMWTPYRLTLGHPPNDTATDPALDTGTVSGRQLNSRSVYRLAINLLGTAILQDQAWEDVFRDPSIGDFPHTSTDFPRVFFVKFVEFSGPREQEWSASSASSQYLKQVLETGDPDGFELVALKFWYELSVQSKSPLN